MPCPCNPPKTAARCWPGAKAFDYVSHSGLFHILQQLGYPATLLAILQGFHDGMWATVQFNGARSNEFDVCCGDLFLGCAATGVSGSGWGSAAHQVWWQLLQPCSSEGQNQGEAHPSAWVALRRQRCLRGSHWTRNSGDVQFFCRCLHRVRTYHKPQ